MEADVCIWCHSDLLTLTLAYPVVHLQILFGNNVYNWATELLNK